MIRHIPGLPRVVAVTVVYVVLIGATLSLTVFVAQTLVVSISEFVASVPRLVADLPTILRPVQEWLQAFGFGQVDVVVAARQVLGYLSESASALVGPLQSLAVASLGAVGTLLIVVMLSVYMVIDQEAIQAFIFRLVPVGQREDFGHLEQAVSRSFGGFLRGQALIGVLYGTVALAASAILGLDFIAVTTAAAGILMAIPFFGPFVSWAPPVIVGHLHQPRPDRATTGDHGRGLVRGERPPAAADGGRGRAPPDRRPRLGHHRLEGGRRGRSDLRHRSQPWRRPLLPLPRDLRPPAPSRSGRRAVSRAARPPIRVTRAPAGRRRGRRRRADPADPANGPTGRPAFRSSRSDLRRRFFQSDGSRARRSGPAGR